MDEVDIVPDPENCFSVAIAGTGEEPMWQVMTPGIAIEGADITVDQFNEVLRNSCVWYPEHKTAIPLLNALAMITRVQLRRWMGQGVDDEVRKRALGEHE